LIIDSYHRNYSLALRHLSALRREYPGQSVELLSRRNSSGRFSSRGHHFQFEVRERQERVELVAHFDYGSSKKKSVIEMQLHVFAPGGLDDSEYIQAIRDRAQGRAWPSREWSARLLEYKSGKKGFRKNSGTNKLPKGLVNEAVLAGEGSIISKATVQPSRSNRRKAK